MAPVTPPELPAELKPSFRLPLWAWLAWGVYVAACVGSFVARVQHSSPSDDMALQLGEVIGQAMGALLFPALLAWLVWRFSGRSSQAGHATFGVVLVLGVLGQLAQLVQRGQVISAMDDLRAESQKLRADQRAAIERGEKPDDKRSEDLARRASEQLGEMARNSSGGERAVAEAMQAYMQGMLAAKEPYDKAAAALSGSDIWTLKDLNTAAAIEARRKHVKDFAAANQALTAFQDRSATALRRELAKHNVAQADADRAVAGYFKGAAGRLEPIAKIRETDAQLADAMLKMLDLGQANLGKWKSPGSPQFAFNDAAANKAYRELIARVQTIAAEQAKAQREALAPKK